MQQWVKVFPFLVLPDLMYVFIYRYEHSKSHDIKLVLLPRLYFLSYTISVLESTA